MTPLVKVFMPPRNILLPKLEDILYSGMIGEGEQVYSFEEQFKKKFNIKYGIAISSGTAALHCALLLSGVNSDDEVITTSMTAEPTNIVIKQVDAIPIFADVDRNTGNVSAEDIEAKITPRTKAILIVHYAGYVVEIEKIRKIADKYGISLIEDCAHALGAKYNNTYVGNFGDFSIFSFQAIKHMTTVDGGFLCMKDPSKLNIAKKMRWFGLEKGVERTKTNIENIGYKYNMNNVTATIGLCQLDYIDNLVNKHKSNGNYYNLEFEKISGIKSASIIPNSEPSYWLYTILCDDCDDIEKKLKNINVSCSKLHKPNHTHSIFNNTSKLPELDLFYQKMLHIPCGWWITHEDREKIINTLRKG